MEENAPNKSNKLFIIAIIFFIFALITVIVVATKVVYNASDKSCTYNGVTYKNGQEFMDDCNNCSCQDGEISCTARACEEYDEYLDEYDESLDEYTGDIPVEGEEELP